jgi:hypothetical protein
MSNILKQFEMLFTETTMPSNPMQSKFKTHSRLRMLKLEQRILFDGAAAAEVVQAADPTKRPMHACYPRVTLNSKNWSMLSWSA